MANSEAVSGVRRQLLNRQRISSQRGIKEPTRPDRYRRGKVSNSGANLQAPRPDPTAGMAETENAKLLEQMKDFVFGKGMVMDQYVQSEKERGIASWLKADKDTRDEYKDAISKGWINHKESPFFREAVTDAYADSLTHNASIKLFTDYEKWEHRNNAESGMLDQFFQEQEDDIAIQMESIPDESLQRRFYEQWQAQKRELTRRHGNHLNAQYKAQSEDAIGNSFYELIEQNSDLLGNSFNSGKPMHQILKDEGITKADIQEAGEILERVNTTRNPHQDGTLSSTEMKKLKQRAEVEGGIWAEMYNGLKKDDEPTIADVTVRTDFEGIEFDPKHKRYVSPEDRELIASQLKSDGNKASSPEKVDRYVGSVARFAGLSDINKTDAQNLKELNSIVAKTPETKVEEQKKVTEVKEGNKIAELVSKWQDSKKTNKLMKEDPNTSGGEGEDRIISKDGGAVSTLPVFLVSAEKKEYPPHVKEWAEQYAAQFKSEGSGVKGEAFALWDSYLKDKYPKSYVPNPKNKKDFYGFYNDNWKKESFNLNDFMSYVMRKRNVGA